MKWIHLSDLHFHSQEERLNSDMLRANLVKFIKYKQITFDYIFLTGDYRYAPAFNNETPEETTSETIDRMVKFIRDLASGSKTPLTNILYIPGNHDVDRFTKEEDIERLKSIVNNYSADSGIISSDDKKFLFQPSRFTFFNKVRSAFRNIGVPDVWGKESYSYKEYEEFNLLLINTSLTCNSNSDRGKLLINCKDLFAINTSNFKKPLIVLSHHELSYIREDERKYFEKFTQKFPSVIYLCGDSHTPWCRAIDNIKEITIGCTYFDGKGEVVVAMGEIKEFKLYKLSAYNWMLTKWGLYTQLNELYDEKFELKTTFAKFITPSINRNRAMQFQGRSTILEQIEKAYFQQEKRIRLTGMGGIGKSEICHQLISRYIQKKHTEFAQFVGWINYSGNMKKSIYNNILEIKSDTIEEYWDKAKEYLNEHSDNTLIIIDNADNLKEEDFENLNELNCNILITSRNPCDKMLNINIQPLDEQECINLYYAHLEYKTDSNEIISRIISLCNRHTLAIELLAKTQSASHITADELYARLKCTGFQLPDIEEVILHNNYSRFIEHIIKLFNISTLENESQQEIIRKFSFLKENITLPYNHAKKLFNLSNYNELMKLQLRGWVSSDLNGYTIHPLISAAMKESASLNIINQNILLKNMSELFLSENQNNFWKFKYTILHATRLIENCENTTKEDIDSYVVLLIRTGLFLNKFGYSHDSQEYTSKAIDTISTQIATEAGVNSVLYVQNLISAIFNRGSAYQKQGRFQEAKLDYQSARELNRAFPDTSVSILIDKGFASLYFDEGQYERALSLQRKIKRRVGDNSGSDTALCYSDIASSLLKLGNTQEAMENFENALNAAETDKNPDRYAIMVLQINIGNCKHAMEDYPAAIDCFTKAETICKELELERTDYMATIYNSIGLSYLSLPRPDLSEKYLMKALSLREEILGSQHLSTAITLGNIGTLLREQGKPEEALSKLKLSYNIYSKLGCTHFREARILLNSIKEIEATL